MTKNIIYGVTGSIAAFKAAAVVSRLKNQDFDITVIMTKSSQNFISPLTFRTLSQNKVITDIFIDDNEYDTQHVSLADRADIVVIAPATANIIGKLASGIADDALTSIVMASNVPVLIAPAMEEKMYINPITQRNIRALQEVGFKFVGPEEGRLASGRTGIGRMAEVELIIQAINAEVNISGQKCSNAKNKSEDKEKKRLRRPAIARLYESVSERHGSLRSS